MGVTCTTNISYLFPNSLLTFSYIVRIDSSIALGTFYHGIYCIRYYLALASLNMQPPFVNVSFCKTYDLSCLEATAYILGWFNLMDTDLFHHNPHPRQAYYRIVSMCKFISNYEDSKLFKKRMNKLPEEEEPELEKAVFFLLTPIIFNTICLFRIVWTWNHFLPFASLGLFQYGLLHFGQITGSSSPYFRGNQIWPHLSHL
jgi:hypothetical protein